jgi:hypothetical protein
MNQGPQFLGIGAQKAATTWLEHCLRRHPEIWLPPRKELHYFDDQADGLRGGRLVFGSSSAVRRMRRELLPRIRSDIRFLNRKELHWDLSYFFGRRTDAWYLALFPCHSRSVSGEITPAYSILDEAAVAHVHSLLPDVKLIFLMRDPIDRSWSQIRMDLAKMSRKICDLSLEEMITLAHSDTVALRSDYHRTLRNWGRHYAADRFFIRFLEDIRDEPQRLLQDLFDFLGVDPSENIAADLLGRRVHASRDNQEIPLELERELARFHLGTIRELESRFGGHAVAWRERAERLIAG